MRNEVYVRQNELYPWVCHKRNGIKFYAVQIVLFEFVQHVLICFFSQKKLHASNKTVYLFT